MNKRAFLRAAISGAALATSSRTVFASGAGTAAASSLPKGYPKKAITLVHGYGAGGSSDIGCRLLAEALKEVVGQPVLVEARPGAGGQIAWTEFKNNAKPDGYEIIYINVPQIHTILFDPSRKAAFTLKDFQPIANHVQDPNVLAVANDSPYKTIEDFLAAAKAKPKGLSITTSGLGGDDHLAALALQVKTGLQFNIIHLKGDSEALKGILGGHMDSMMANVGGMLRTVQAGQTRILAVMSESRYPDLPDVPTFKEKGIDLQASSTRGIAMPAATPVAIAKYMEQSLKTAMESAMHKEAMKKAGFALTFMGTKEYGAFLESQSAWTQTMMKQYMK